MEYVLEEIDALVYILPFTKYVPIALIVVFPLCVMTGGFALSYLCLLVFEFSSKRLKEYERGGYENSTHHVPISILQIR